jgi:hypothetical protein
MKNIELKPIMPDKNLIAYCGLYCGACRSYLKGSCPGCRENVKATWCKIRQCCSEQNFASCADCSSIKPEACSKYNTLISRVIGVILNSNRAACIHRIEEVGYDQFAIEMAENKRQTIKRK